MMALLSVTLNLNTEYLMKLAMPRFDHGQVLVLGDVMLDRYWYGDTKRISPEAPVPVVKVNKQENRPGGAANVALNLAALGSGVKLAGITGKDEAAEVLSEQLKSAGIVSNYVSSSAHPTICKQRVMSQQQQLIRMDFEEAFSLQESEALIELAIETSSECQVAIVSDYAKGSIQQPTEFIKQAKAKGIKVLVDPKGDCFDKYAGAYLITPNMTEFQTVVGEVNSEQEMVTKGLELIDKLDLEALLITRSEKGMTLLRKGYEEFHLPALAKEVYDVTGAGDTVISTLAAALACNTQLEQAVALANTAAGLVVSKLGTATVSGPELRIALQNSQGAERGIVSEEQLMLALADARAQGEKIVFTNGCFDILHAGHVGYLEQARALGDRLVLAINSDRSVKALKGEGRPINPVERRKAVLAGLEAVDWVLDFDEDTPENLLRKVKPEILVKGGDYSLEEVVGADIVHGYGGEVNVLSFLDNCSTTAIVRKIQQQKG